jgi:hypothetical protein
MKENKDMIEIIIKLIFIEIMKIIKLKLKDLNLEYKVTIKYIINSLP